MPSPPSYSSIILTCPKSPGCSFSRQYGGASPSGSFFGVTYVDQIDPRKQENAAWVAYLNSPEGKLETARLGISVLSVSNPDDAPLSLRKSFIDACPETFNSTSSSVSSGSVAWTGKSSALTVSTTNTEPSLRPLDDAGTRGTAHGDGLSVKFSPKTIASLVGASKLDAFTNNTYGFTTSKPVNPNSNAASSSSLADNDPVTHPGSPTILVNGGSVNGRSPSINSGISLMNPISSLLSSEGEPDYAKVLEQIGFVPLGSSKEKADDDDEERQKDHEDKRPHHQPSREAQPKPTPLPSRVFQRFRDDCHAWRRTRASSRHYRRDKARSRSAWMGDEMRDRLESLSLSSLWGDLSSVLSSRSRDASTLSTNQSSDAKPLSKLHFPVSVIGSARHFTSAPAESALTTSSRKQSKNVGREPRRARIALRRRPQAPRRSRPWWSKRLRRKGFKDDRQD